MTALNFVSIANTDFQLKNADISKTNIAEIVNPHTKSSSACEDECSGIYDRCRASGLEAYICEYVEEECYRDCDG